MKTKKYISRFLVFLLFVSIILSLSCTGKKSTTEPDPEKVVFTGSTRDSVEVLKTLSYSKRTHTLYQWVSDYLKNEEKNLDITPEEYSIRITALRSVFGRIVNKAVEEILQPGTNCSQNHNLLNELGNEIEKLLAFDKLNHEVKSKLESNQADYKQHNHVLSFCYSVQSKGTEPYSVSGTYDTGYPEQILNEIRTLIYPHSCVAIANAKAGVPSRLDKRHRAFLEKLVELYCAQEKYEYSVESQVTQQIDLYYLDGSSGEWALKYGTSSSGAKSFTDGLIASMKRFNELKSTVQQ